MPAASTEERDGAAVSPAPPSEPSPTVGRSEGGQFVKVTYLRPEFAPDDPDHEEGGGGSPARGPQPTPQASGASYQLVTLVREKAATTAGAGLGLLGLLAVRSWRR